MTYVDLGSWQRRLRFEYPSVRFEQSAAPAGVRAICEGALVGRYFAERVPPVGVVYPRPRSSGGQA